VKGLQIGSKTIDFDSVKAGAGRSTQHIHDAKTEALCELVDEMQGRPLLVGFEYKHDRQRISAALPRAEFIDGSTSQKESQDICAAWNRGEVPVLCVHPAAAGHGLNLQGSNCAHVAWYTTPWDFDLYTQTIGRVFRQGNKAKTVFVHRILARGTVDVVVARALRTKERTQDALMLALRAYAKDRK
jgi:SNF2 family DNA or RNA helicase